MMIQMGGHAIFCNNTHVVNKRTIRIHVKACPEEAYAAAGTSKKFHEHMELIASRKERQDGKHGMGRILFAKLPYSR